MAYKRRIIITSFALLGCACTASLAMSSLSLAAFSDTKQVTQQAGYAGTLKTSIFFNANIWEVDSPLFYLYAYKGSGGVDPEFISSSKTINPTIGGVVFTLYVFEYDTVKYDGIIFARINPSGANVPSFTTNDNPQTLWNQTSNITYSSSYNYYCIDGWGSSDWSNNHLSVNNNGDLVFG